MLVKRFLQMGTAALVSVSLFGCAGMTNVEKDMSIGALAGGTIGGLWGSSAGGELNAGEGLLVGAAAGGAIGALIGDQQDKAFHQDQADALAAKDAQIASLQEENRSLQAKVGDLTQQLATAQRRIKDLEAQLAAKGPSGMPRREITLLSDVLFTPGHDTLTAAGRSALDDAAEKINAAGSDKFVQIEGHTDSDPIKASPWKSNWELGAARSLAVLHYLTSKGVAPERLSAATFGQYQPVASNDSSEGKSKNRRSVIVIYSNWVTGGK